MANRKETGICKGNFAATFGNFVADRSATVSLSFALVLLDPGIVGALARLEAQRFDRGAIGEV